MYQVNIGTKILYYPGSEDAAIFDTDLNEEVGLAGEFTFRVPPTNPAYSSLTQGALVTILKDGTEFWRGEIRDIKTDFAKIAEVYVLEDVAWLGDEFLAPNKITNQTYAQRLQAAIASYNANRASDRQFTVGYITNVTGSDTCNWTTEYEWSILDSIRNCICKDNGYIRIRRSTSGGTVTRYIDVVRLEDYGVAASQPIEYGYNLLDYVKESDYGNLTNVLTPYGDELEDEEVYEDYGKRLQGTTISNTSSINTYGRHAKAVVFDGVTTLAQLNSLAQSYLTRYCQPQLTMEVQAVDLAEIENVDSIKIGDSVRVIAKPFAVDQRLYLTQIRRDIQNIDKNTITLSGNVVRKGLTKQMITVMDAIEEVPIESNILKAAKKNALNMLLDETQGGYVVFEYDSNNEKMIAINICNAQTIAASTKRWRWAQNGFGYMSRANTNVAWTDLGVAMTINGEIVADFIKSGTIDTARLSVSGIVNGINSGSTTINGGKITTNSISANKLNVATLSAITAYLGKVYCGGNGNGNGEIEVQNSSGTTKVRLNSNGIVADSECIAVIGGGYIKHHEDDTGDYHQWVFDLGCKYCNCQYEDDGWHWVNGGATKIYKYLEGAYNPSDQRAKTEIEELDPEFSKELIMRTSPKMFEFTYKRGVKQFGMIAQDEEEILKDLGFTDPNGLIEIPEDPEEWWSIEYKQFIPHLINMVKSQQAEIDLLKEEIQALKERSNNG